MLPANTTDFGPAHSTFEETGTDENDRKGASGDARLEGYLTFPTDYRALMEQLVLPPALRTGGNGWT